MSLTTCILPTLSEAEVALHVANIARDGTADRAVALRDAEAAAKALRLAGFRTLMIDLSDTRTGPAAKLAEAMGADYLPLPHADASRISASVNAAMKAGA